MEMNEENKEQLKQLCDVCKSRKRCKDINKICAFKKMAWFVAERKYKRLQKQGALENNGCN